VNLFTSFGFFGDQGELQALREFRRVLRPGRALVLEAPERGPLSRESRLVLVASAP
jgi:hypothetical protein